MHHSFFFNFDKKIALFIMSLQLRWQNKITLTNGACSRCCPDSFLYRFGV
jgi:hypothetical protein